MTLAVNWDPLSVRRKRGGPYRPKMSRSSLAASSAAADGAARSSTNLEKQSMATMMNELPWASTGNGPIVSTATVSNGSWTAVVRRVAAKLASPSLTFWQTGQDAMYADRKSTRLNS